MKATAVRQTEAGFTTAVIAFAKLHGWMVNHQRPARTSRGWRTATEGDAGFPDLVFAKNGRVVFAELKVKSRPTRLQTAWLSAIGEAFVWTPSDWPSIELVLAKGIT